VGRAVRGKYVQHPGGICELRALFARGTESAASPQTPDSGTSREGVKRMIRELVASEDKEAPLNDDRIVTMLRASGVDISRRTAAKYRGEMGIGGMHNRS
jgi:RNA polymerase sigma-54 factor